MQSSLDFSLLSLTDVVNTKVIYNQLTVAAPAIAGVHSAALTKEDSDFSHYCNCDYIEVPCRVSLLQTAEAFSYQGVLRLNCRNWCSFYLGHFRDLVRGD